MAINSPIKLALVVIVSRRFHASMVTVVPSDRPRVIPDPFTIE